ncbi:uncharacterized protein LOC116769566 isoform X2 [Danaus plexippus]|uniref:uncharacterized protein LOC116769566 isoform X2 n=1 Tax=Danaus plexippus TaxID=13037 RepID=UPI002AAFE207|nr:uncharacterized protein LOC116769566 isoform X2 [Danaus plexippus]
MSKQPAPKASTNDKIDLTRFCRSTFTLTFAIEIIGIDVWHDCNEGWLDLGPPIQGMKLQYQLYPNQSFDLDILIWPHVAKIWCGNQYGFVRTWQFLERRWMAFSIRHAFPLRVLDLIKHLATVTPSMGLGALSANAKNDKNVEVYLPPLAFGERRYFGSVFEHEIILGDYIQDYIWHLVECHIPSSHLDGIFDKPNNVTAQRHQDAVLFHVQETILKAVSHDHEELLTDPEELIKSKERRDSKIAKEKEKKKVVEIPKVKFEINLSGNTILAGIGRVIPFESLGDRPPDMPEVIVLISSANLPAQDDLPILFINIENIYDVPVQELKRAGFNQIYTNWKLYNESHDSPKETMKSLKPIKFNDHHTFPLPYEVASEIIPIFLSNPFEIQLRGVQNTKSPPKVGNFFGNEKFDSKFGSMVPFFNSKMDENDVLIAVTKIDTTILTRSMNGFIKGEFPLFPPIPEMDTIPRECICTNDINSIRWPTKQKVALPSHIVLQAQMTLEVSMGLVGCRPQDLGINFSRLYCLAEDKISIDAVLEKIKNINEETLQSSENNDYITGFAIDTGNIVLFYLEGRRGGAIFKIWEFSEDFYPKLKPVFSCSEKHINRIYPDLLTSATPFLVLKMFVPLTSLLACPQVYVKPALPLPARTALLKIGRIIENRFKIIPKTCDMPTYGELKSLTLELCSPSYIHPTS